VPLPCPLVWDAKETHDAALDTDQVQSRDVSTVSVAEPPAGGAVDIELATATWHFDAVGVVTCVEDEVQLRTRAAGMMARSGRIAQANRGFTAAPGASRLPLWGSSAESSAEEVGTRAAAMAEEPQARWSNRTVQRRPFPSPRSGVLDENGVVDVHHAATWRVHPDANHRCGR
jgi:hypothetical protein